MGRTSHFVRSRRDNRHNGGQAERLDVTAHTVRNKQDSQPALPGTFLCSTWNAKLPAMQPGCTVAAWRGAG
jgi:hypothetical protein